MADTNRTLSPAYASPADPARRTPISATARPPILSRLDVAAFIVATIMALGPLATAAVASMHG